MNNIFVSWKQKIESRIISDLKSQYTESEEQIRQRKEQFLKKQKKIILIEIIAGAVFLAFLIIRAAFLQDDILLSRNSFGQGSKEVQLSLKKDDKKKEITYKLDEQKLSAEEESKVYIQFFKKLKKIMMKNNTSLKQIQTPLNLPDTVDGYPFEITYELAEDGYIRLDGSINEEEQAKLKRGETYRTYIVVTARYGEYRKSKKYEIRIVPKKNISQTNVFYKIQQYLKKEEQENRYSRDIKIPSVYKDIEITKRQENQGGISGILILFVTVCIFIPLHNYLKLQEEGKKCQEQAERDFPVIVHLLTLYMGAGLSFFSAVKRISQNYKTTWNLTLKTMGEQLRNKQIVKKGKKNISYKDYLKLFLLTKGNSRTVCYRMMDIMQENIASKEPGFLMENCLFSYSWKGSLAAGGVKLNFVKQCSY